MTSRSRRLGGSLPSLVFLLVGLLPAVLAACDGGGSSPGIDAAVGDASTDSGQSDAGADDAGTDDAGADDAGAADDGGTTTATTTLQVSFEYVGTSQTIDAARPALLVLFGPTEIGTEITSAGPTTLTFDDTEGLVAGQYMAFAFADGNGDGVPSHGEPFATSGPIDVLEGETSQHSVSLSDSFTVQGTFEIPITNFPVDGEVELFVQRRHVVPMAYDSYVMTEDRVTVDVVGGAATIRLVESLFSPDTNPQPGRSYMIRVLWDGDGNGYANNGGDDVVAMAATNLQYIRGAAPYSLPVDWSADAETFVALSTALGPQIDATVTSGPPNVAGNTTDGTNELVLGLTYLEGGGFYTRYYDPVLSTDASGDGSQGFLANFRQGQAYAFMFLDENGDGEWGAGEPISYGDVESITGTTPVPMAFGSWFNL